MKLASKAFIDKCDRQALIEAIDMLRAWYGYQSSLNSSQLYNGASKLFKSDFNPAEYDDVE